MEYSKIVVTFYKGFGVWNSTKVEITHIINKAKSMYENECEAFDKAVRMGHDPRKNIHMRFE